MILCNPCTQKEDTIKLYYDSGEGQIFHGDSLEVLKTMPDESIQCCITSPPYWGLRDYGIDGQLGLEKTPEEYVEKIVEIFREVRRVLRSDGTLWLNLGDSYISNPPCRVNPQSFQRNSNFKGGSGEIARPPGSNHNIPGLKPKDLIGIPWRVALALQADGWWLRSDIIWHKPNPMPESVTDRPTKAHEYLFLLTKSARYYYDADAIREPLQTPPHSPGWASNVSERNDRQVDNEANHRNWGNESGRNKRTVWTIPTKPFPKAHFATFPPALIEPCILAGTSEKGCCVTCGIPWERVVEKTKYNPPTADIGERFVDDTRGDKNRKLSGKDYNEQAKSKTIGWQPTCKCEAGTTPCTVLDPFGGAMTTAITAYKHGRKFVMIELSQAYIDDIGIPRIKKATEQLKLFT